MSEKMGKKSEGLEQELHDSARPKTKLRIISKTSAVCLAFSVYLKLVKMTLLFLFPHFVRTLFLFSTKSLVKLTNIILSNRIKIPQNASR